MGGFLDQFCTYLNKKWLDQWLTLLGQAGSTIYVREASH